MVLARLLAAPCASWREIINDTPKPGEHNKLVRFKLGNGITVPRNGHGSHKVYMRQSLRGKSRHPREKHATSYPQRRCTAQGMPL